MAKSGMKKNMQKPVNQAAELRDTEEFDSESDSETALPLVKKRAKEGGHRMMGESTRFPGWLRVVMMLFAGLCICRELWRCCMLEIEETVKLFHKPLRDETKWYLSFETGPKKDPSLSLIQSVTEGNTIL